MSVLPTGHARFATSVPVGIVGAGACGLIAALALSDGGVAAVLFERDAVPCGSTALSSGFIPAAGTRFQRERGIDDSPALLATDIQRKNHELADPAVVRAVAEAAAPTLEWLADRHGIPFVVVEGFLYPGHSRLRMHAHPDRTGAALMAALRDATERAGIDVLTNARVVDLFADPDGRVTGLRIERPDGSSEDIGCAALILACNGFGGNRAMVRRHIPEMAEALYFGHAGNQGDAMAWGEALGAELRHMSAYQGHGSVAHPHNMLVTWALMMEGGIQINARGERFSNEHQGYSEQAVAVLQQPGAIAWNIYDARLHALGREFEDYRQADAAGAVRTAKDLDGLAAIVKAPLAALTTTFAEIARYHRAEARDPFGRDFATKPMLKPPYHAVKVTGALFHTQGGLRIDTHARVLRADGRPLPNLFCGGGAACGISGPAVWGYLSGNGLLTAVTLGFISGSEAGRLCGSTAKPAC